MSARFRVASLSELELPSIPSMPRWAAVRHRLEIGAFGVNAWTAQEAGQELIGEHDELGPRAGNHEELYFVVSGRATFTVDGEEVAAPAGTFVFVHDLVAKRRAVAEEAETTVLVVGAPPGEAFTPSQWERSAPALAYFATKEYDKARALLSEHLVEYPDDAGALFNLACAESLLGRADDALEHLEAAIAGDEAFRRFAREDSDFDPIRDDPRFSELVG